jgi:hypothetical protein
LWKRSKIFGSSSGGMPRPVSMTRMTSCLEAGRRRRLLEEAFAKTLEEDFEGRVLAFDTPAAQAAGRIAAERRRLGRAVEIRDVQIAGIAASRKATVATRNVRHFEGCELTLIDPWSTN